MGDSAFEFVDKEDSDFNAMPDDNDDDAPNAGYDIIDNKNEDSDLDQGSED